MRLKLSCCAWALAYSEAAVLTDLAGAGFEWIDVRPQALRSRGSRQRLEGLGMRVSCVAAAFPEVPLDSTDKVAAESARESVSAALIHARELGATMAYVVPGMDARPVALNRFARALEPLAEQAMALGLKLGVEHFPGRSLPSVEATLAFVRGIGHPNLYLLLDTGHAQISGEDPAAAVELAGSRLGYVHLDDNDGRQDLHLALLDGVLTREALRRTLAALAAIGYEGAVSLELHPQLPDPLAAIRRSVAILEEFLPPSRSAPAGKR